jgi:hypothetical protein
VTETTTITPRAFEPGTPVTYKQRRTNRQRKAVARHEFAPQSSWPYMIRYTALDGQLLDIWAGEDELELRPEPEAVACAPAPAPRPRHGKKQPASEVPA